MTKMIQDRIMHLKVCSHPQGPNSLPTRDSHKWSSSTKVAAQEQSLNQEIPFCSVISLLRNLVPLLIITKAKSVLRFSFSVSVSIGVHRDFRIRHIAIIVFPHMKSSPAFAPSLIRSLIPIPVPMPRHEDRRDRSDDESLAEAATN